MTDESKKFDTLFFLGRGPEQFENITIHFKLAQLEVACYTGKFFGTHFFPEFLRAIIAIDAIDQADFNSKGVLRHVRLIEFPDIDG